MGPVTFTTRFEGIGGPFVQDDIAYFPGNTI